jgi:cytochrome c oxidase assembly protein subunit 15
MIRSLALVACLLTVCITASSAFIRHWGNGVGCDGWPDCYRAAHASGAPAASGASAPIGAAGATDAAGAQAVEPSGQAGPRERSALDAAVATIANVPSVDAPPPVRIARALHRVSATLAGVLVLLVVVFGWSSMGGGARIAAAVALVDTVFLSWLGRYTPHDLPLVTLGNLVGGLLLAVALAWIAAARGVRGVRGVPPGSRRVAVTALALVGLLAWGGTMIGARHAIDACATPLCASGARFDAAAIDPTRATVAVDAAAAQGLHVAHRLVGLLLAIAVAMLALRLRAARPAVAAWLALLVAAQLVLGAGTALGTQPLLTTTLHNAVAALLAVALAAVAGSATAASAAPRRSAG